jgi:hypothetical protein
VHMLILRSVVVQCMTHIADPFVVAVLRNL